MSFEKTAAAVITGNEILSGKVTDQNSPYLAEELRALGVHLERIVVVPDRVAEIASEISFCHSRFDLVFTTGGIGPTHDDVTLEAIAHGLNRPYLPHSSLFDILKTYSDHETVVTKMASVPEGTELIYAEGLRTPVLKIENIYVFPGVVEFFRKKFNALKERFRESPFYLTRIFVCQHEEKIVTALHQTVERFPQLRIGSYPVLHQTDYKGIVTLESKDPEIVKKGAETLLQLLPTEWIAKVESVPSHPLSKSAIQS